MVQMASPTVRARRLRRELARLRNRAGLTAEDVARRLGWHRTKIIRIENGHSRLMRKDMDVLFDLYEISYDERESLTTLARQAHQKGWWSAYGDVLPDDYLGFEAEASSISTFESLYVPGLLQTEEYARAIIRAGRYAANAEDVDRLVAARQARKALLARDVPPDLWVVMDEAAVRRAVGGTETMRQQIMRLIDACEAPSVVIQILPFGAGAHAAMGGPFTILDYTNPALDPTVVYIGNDTSTLLIEEERHVARYRLMFDHLRVKALDPDRSSEFLTRVVDEHQTWVRQERRHDQLGVVQRGLAEKQSQRG